MRAAALAAAALLVVLLAPTAAARQLRAAQGRRPQSRKHWNGQGAVAALGRAKLARVEANSRRRGDAHAETVDDLAKRLQDDPELAVDVVNEQLMFLCEGMAPPTISEAAITSGTAPSQPDPLSSSALQLHSRPGARFKLLLDFTGRTTTGSLWNGWAPASIDTPAYDTDGNAAAFSSSELSDIVAIWRAVSEDYSMWDVDVTTDEAALAGYDPTLMAVAAIGGSWSDWYGSSAGGVSYINAFGKDNQQPSFIFAKSLGSVKNVWEAVSHELGHSLGLSHDGAAGSSYYGGVGGGSTGWAPIMGSAYNQQVSTFDRGEYANATNQQDDFAVISGFLPPLSTGMGSSLATATPLSVSVDASNSATGRASGIITGPDATAWMSFPAAAGALILGVATTAPSGTSARTNLYWTLTLYGPDGAILNCWTGFNLAGASLMLPATGTYYLSLAGAGYGDPLTVGFSSFVSRGQFEVTANFVPCASACATAAPAAPSGACPAPPPPPVYRVSTMTLARVTMTNSAGQAIGYACTSTVYLKDSAGNAVPSGVSTKLHWNLLYNGVPYTGPAYSYPTTASSGTVATRSATINSLDGGYGCQLVFDAIIGNYALDPTSIMNATRTWGVAASPSPALAPSPSPALLPSPSPIVPSPALEPSPSPALEPSPSPVLEPSPSPALEPSPSPALEPSPSPALLPSPSPALEPSPSPSLEPSPSPVLLPSPSPALLPSPSPALAPSPSPVLLPSPSPALAPSPSPVLRPSPSPALAPSPSPVLRPSPSPALAPSPSPVLRPSPSPALAPSPSPALRPSPSPALASSPSPALRPSPSPQPSAGTPMIIVTPIALTTANSGSNKICTAKVTIKAGTVLVGGANVTGTWVAKQPYAGWNATQSALTGTSGTALGVATFTAPAMPKATGVGWGCSFSISAVAKTGYVLTTAVPLSSAVATW